MPLLFLLFGLLLPRITAVILWLFTDWFSSAYDNWIIPLLGFIFLPYSMLWYSAVQNWFSGLWGPWQMVFMVLAVALDLSSYGSIHRAE